VSVLLHLGGVGLAVGWPALFERRLASIPAPDKEATVEVLMGSGAEETGGEAGAPAPSPVPAVEPPRPEVPQPTDQASLQQPPPSPPAAVPSPTPAPPVWQSSTLLGDGAVGAAEIIGDRLKPALGERGNAPPGYPAASVQRGEQGVVVVRMRIGPDGQVTDVQVVESSGYDRLDAAARAALARWHFTPAIQNGEAVESFQDLPIRFRLN
jgi:protein TonB